MKKFFFTVSFFVLIFLSPLPSCAASELPDLVRVGLEREFKNIGRVSIDNTYLTVGFNADGYFSPLQTVQSSGGFELAAESGSQMVLYDGNQAVLYLDDSAYPIQIRDGNGGNVSLNGTEYMNTVELCRRSAQSFTAVNVLTPQEYLYSTVNTEMREHFHPEALKAQAVALRTYLLHRLLGVHEEQGYDMCDQGHCLGYDGAERNHPITIAAVDETDGVIAYYNGEPINAVFFSSSGGATDNSENVWTEAVPYLRGVTDTEEYEPMEWTRTFSWDELTGLLSKNNISIGRAVNVAVTKNGAGGRVLELTIYAESGSETLTKENIRTFFSSSEGGSLAGRNFSLTGGVTQAADLFVTDGTAEADKPDTVYVISSGGEAVQLTDPPVIYNRSFESSVSGGDGVTFTGSGWGHGVGMSQHGAEGLARAGYNYVDILKHYYSGVEIY